MLRKTHVRIALEVFTKLGISLSEDEKERLTKGVIDPDRWGLADLPHHYGKEKQIRYYLLQSRKYFLRYDLLGAYYYLGIALHYVQDSYVSMASFYFKHQSWEERIEDCSYVSELEKAIHYWLRHDAFERNRCLGLTASLTNEVQGRDNTLNIATLSGHKQFTSFAKPIIDYNLSFRASYLVTKSVLSPRSNTQLNSALRRSLACHEGLMHDAEVATSQEIVQIAKDIENLESKKIAKSGIIPKLKNGFLTLRAKVKELQLESKYNGYVKKKHLLKIISEYRNETSRITNPHVGWYTFSIPELNLGNAENELIPIQDASRHFGVDEAALAELVSNSIISSYRIGNQRIVIRRELNQALKL